MRILLETKHLSVAFKYRDRYRNDDDEEGQRVSNTGGSFDIADTVDEDIPGDEPDMYFGFLRG